MKRFATVAPPASPTRVPALLGPSSIQRIRSRLTAVDVETVFVGAVVLTAFLASVLWALILPFNTGPDEVHHFNMDWYIAVHNGLPIFDQSPDINHTTCTGNAGPCYASYASVPPGGPLLGAALMKLAHLVTGRPYEPFHGFMGSVAPLDIYMKSARMASALCIAVYVVFLYLTSRMLFEDPLVRATALMIGAFIPEVTFIGGYVNDDSIEVAASAIMLYLSVRLLRDGMGTRTALATGAGLGLLALSRVNAYAIFAVFAFFALLRLIQEWRSGRGLTFVRLLLLAGGAFLLTSGWWFVRGELLYRDPIGLTVWRRHIDAIAPGYGASTLAGHGASLLTLLQDPIWKSWTFDSFWGEFDYMALQMSPHVYGTIRFFILLSAVGLLFALGRYFHRQRGIRVPGADVWRAQAWALFGLLIVLVIWQSLWNSLTDWFQPQGRYLFPALIPVALILAAGFQGWSSRREYRAPAFGFIAAAMLVLNIYALVFVVVPAYNSW